MRILLGHQTSSYDGQGFRASPVVSVRAVAPGRRIQSRIFCHGNNGIAVSFGDPKEIVVGYQVESEAIYTYIDRKNQNDSKA